MEICDFVSFEAILVDTIFVCCGMRFIKVSNSSAKNLTYPDHPVFSGVLEFNAPTIRHQLILSA
jgi:hypothetical protein